MNARLAAALLSLSALDTAQAAPSPVLDMHVHAPRLADFTALAGGKLPMPHCVPMTDLPVPESGSKWPDVFGLADPPCRATFSPTTDDDVMKQALAIMERRNIIGLASGPRVAEWAQAAPNRIIPSLGLGGGPNAPTVEAMRGWFAAGRFTALGEVSVQYGGMEPDDPWLRPYWALAEEMAVPVGLQSLGDEDAAAEACRRQGLIHEQLGPAELVDRGQRDARARGARSAAEDLSLGDVSRRLQPNRQRDPPGSRALGQRQEPSGFGDVQGGGDHDREDRRAEDPRQPPGTPTSGRASAGTHARGGHGGKPTATTLESRHVGRRAYR
jgi:hypothetical protein